MKLLRGKHHYKSYQEMCKALEIEPENRKTFPSFLIIRREKYGAGTPGSTPGGVFPGKRQAALAF